MHYIVYRPRADEVKRLPTKIKAASDWLALRRSQSIAANDLSIKTARAANNYFAGGVSIGLSAGVVAAGAVVAGFVAGFFSAQPTAAMAVTSSVNANSFFMPWSPETRGTISPPAIGVVH
jgi:hypothetical protein